MRFRCVVFAACIASFALSLVAALRHVDHQVCLALTMPNYEEVTVAAAAVLSILWKLSDTEATRPG